MSFEDINRKNRCAAHINNEYRKGRPDAKQKPDRMRLPDGDYSNQRFLDIEYSTAYLSKVFILVTDTAKLQFSSIPTRYYNVIISYPTPVANTKAHTTASQTCSVSAT